MKNFRRFAFLSTIATYILIFIGGLVRVSGAGLGCPDWPKCFGGWIPPLSAAGIPQGIDPSTFNLTLAWIEYGNRLMGMTTGLLILITAILALVHFRRFPKILYPTLLAALLVAYQGWQGGQVVASELRSLLVSVHLLLAFLIASLLMYVSHQASLVGLATTQESKSRYPKWAPLAIAFLWFSGLVQILAGTQVRTSVESASAQYPLWSDLQWLSTVGWSYGIHMVIGTLLAFFTWIATLSILKSSDRPSAVVSRAAWGLNILVAVQLAMGLALVAWGLTEVLQVFHLWIAGLYVGLVLLMYFATRVESSETAPAAGFGGPAKAVVIGTVALMLLAIVVVRSADASRADIPELATVPPFEFVDQAGAPFGLSQMQGKISVVDFFFTNCHGPCPFMSATFAEMFREFAHSDKLQFVSFTVDPSQDSLPVLNEYASRFGATSDRWHFVFTGTPDSISVFCEKGFMVSGDLPGMHSTKFILVDSQGKIRGFYDYDDPSHIKILKAHIRQLVRELP
ncbi:MAG: COX15/CtaA family protein [Candidatus Zixiibacteriota bacterium]